MKHLYIVKVLALVRYSVISVAILWFYIFYLTHLLNARLMLTYYPTLIVNVFALLLLKRKGG